MHHKSPIIPNPLLGARSPGDVNAAIRRLARLLGDELGHIDGAVTVGSVAKLYRVDATSSFTITLEVDPTNPFAEVQFMLTTAGGTVTISNGTDTLATLSILGDEVALVCDDGTWHVVSPAGDDGGGGGGFTSIRADTVQELKALGTDNGIYVGQGAILTPTGNTWIAVTAGASTSTWRPGNGVYHAADYGVVADDATDNSVALQAWLDDVLAVYGDGKLPVGSVRHSVSLRLYDPCNIQGSGSPSSRWNDSNACTHLVWTGEADEYSFEIGATSMTTNAEGRICEGVRLRNLLIRPLVPGEGRGILIDGSQADDVLRNAARDIRLYSISLRDLDGGIHNRGSVFDSSFHLCYGEPHSTSSRSAFICEQAASIDASDSPDDLAMYQCLFDSPGVGVYAAELGGCVAFDCKFQGIDGVRLTSRSALYGTDHESEGSKAVGSVGITVAGRGVTLHPNLVDGYDVGISVGDGTATQCDGIGGSIATLADCNTGIHVTAGGVRAGYLSVRDSFSVATAVTDDRRTANGISEFFVGDGLRVDTRSPSSYPIAPNEGFALVTSTGAQRSLFRWDGSSRWVESKNSTGTTQTRISIADGQDVEQWVIGEHSGNPGRALIKLRCQQYTERINHLPTGTTETLDWNHSNVHKVDLESATGDVTLTLSNPQDGAVYKVIVQQDATTPRNLIWPASVRWPGGTAPTISTGADDVDVITLVYDGALSAYLGTFAQDFS